MKHVIDGIDLDAILPDIAAEIAESRNLETAAEAVFAKRFW